MIATSPIRQRCGIHESPISFPMVLFSSELPLSMILENGNGITYLLSDGRTDRPFYRDAMPHLKTTDERPVDKIDGRRAKMFVHID